MRGGEALDWLTEMGLWLTKWVTLPILGAGLVLCWLGCRRRRNQ